MRSLVCLTLLSLALAGCKSEKELNQLRSIEAMRTGEMSRNAAIEQAIISQHTFYPYHFVSGTAHLNSLGRNDLSVLVRHYMHAAGELSLSRGDANDALYQARSQALAAELKSAGIASGRVSVVEGRPGGDGISGARLVKILDAPTGPLGATPSASGTQGSVSSVTQQ